MTFLMLLIYSHWIKRREFVTLRLLVWHWNNKAYRYTLQSLGYSCKNEGLRNGRNSRWKRVISVPGTWNLLLYSSVPPRPTRPPKFDEAGEYEKLKQNALEKRRAPGTIWKQQHETSVAVLFVLNSVPFVTCICDSKWYQRNLLKCFSFWENLVFKMAYLK